MEAAPLRDVLVVGAGGFIGAGLRYAASGLTYRLVPRASFPWGTLVVNVAGCLAIGYLAGLDGARPFLGPGVRRFLFLGVLGGFTTYSTFSYETITLLAEGDRLRAVGNVLLHLTLGLGAAWGGFALGHAR